MKRYEYKIMDFMSDALRMQSKREAVLNQLGREGWELIAVANGSWYFKREL